MSREGPTTACPRNPFVFKAGHTCHGQTIPPADGDGNHIKPLHSFLVLDGYFSEPKVGKASHIMSIIYMDGLTCFPVLMLGFSSAQLKGAHLIDLQR